jgi:hypothetical protein
MRLAEVILVSNPQKELEGCTVVLACQGRGKQQAGIWIGDGQARRATEPSSRQAAVAAIKRVDPTLDRFFGTEKIRKQSWRKDET